MFKNKTADGKLNLCGKNIERMRKFRNISQRALADDMQLNGLDLGKNAVQQIESGMRFVTDIELQSFADYFEVRASELLKQEP